MRKLFSEINNNFLVDPKQIIRCKGTIHLRRWQIFTIFDPYPHPSAVFYYYLLANLPHFELLPPPPPPLKNTDVLNGWSQTILISSSRFELSMLHRLLWKCRSIEISECPFRKDWTYCKLHLINKSSKELTCE